MQFTDKSAGNPEGYYGIVSPTGVNRLRGLGKEQSGLKILSESVKTEISPIVDVGKLIAEVTRFISSFKKKC